MANYIFSYVEGLWLIDRFLHLYNCIKMSHKSGARKEEKRTKGKNDWLTQVKFVK